MAANSRSRWSYKQVFKLGSAVRALRTAKENERYEAHLASQGGGAPTHDVSEDDGSEHDSDRDDDEWNDDDGMWD
jgi:hypothetical protein